jgi:hypothetical protein
MTAAHQGPRPFVPDPAAAMVRYQVTQVQLEDPDGNPIEFHEAPRG